MGRPCSTQGEEEKNAYRVLVGNPEGKRPAGTLKHGGRMILRCMLEK
jgi:hypothetical protein